MGDFTNLNLTLLEYGKTVRTAHAAELRDFLRSLWAYRVDDVAFEESSNEDVTRPGYQPFLTFDGDTIRANNYVGFIQSDDELIEIYPKVFRGIENPEQYKELMLRHIFFWFDFCRKWKFPFTKASLDRFDFDSLPELIINLISRQFLEAVSQQPLHLYHPIEDVLSTPRGAINFKRYINNGFATGNIHEIDCDYEPFLYDNRVNRIIKYCTRLLIGRTKVAENVRLLQEIIFVLDEVEDIACTLHDVEAVSINAFFGDYSACMDSCKTILENHLYSSNSNDLSQWCLLFPMEYIFEDFVAGFLEDRLRNEWRVEYQKSDKYLVDQPYKVFMMQHDILLTERNSDGRKLIVDTKYKVRDKDFKTDKKRGIAQSDLYQMASYAFRRGCDDVLLLYPNISEEPCEPDVFMIDSGFDDQRSVRVTAAEIPFWSHLGPVAVVEQAEKALSRYLFPN